ncbi:hypothetical protein F183_A21110 [Bryobacterales bacterium F-183]|nr:hypothetical protein F183_A21110 [Bryobacterales bacterium F-183]
MDKVAQLSLQDRKDIFAEVAELMAVRPVIAEKDFWVCYVLNVLFTRLSIREHLVFKGGTSLSKAYGLIERFSEDIDLILDWQLLGIMGSAPLQGKTSKTQQDKFNKEANRMAASFIAEKLLPELNDLFRQSKTGLTAEVKESDPHVVDVYYPASFAERYIRPEVRLEIGPLGAWTPSAPQMIQPYAAVHLPHLFTNPACSVLTVAAERTFWEKATILHQEAHRDEAMPQRHSRHFYDLYRLATSPVRNAALSQLPLLDAVVKFKMQFYPSAWARYDLAVPGSFKLLPATPAQLSALERDYEDMQVMFFGRSVEFSAVLTTLRDLEAEVNALTR